MILKIKPKTVPLKDIPSPASSDDLNSSFQGACDRPNVSTAISAFLRLARSSNNVSIKHHKPHELLMGVLFINKESVESDFVCLNEGCGKTQEKTYDNPTPE